MEVSKKIYQIGGPQTLAKLIFHWVIKSSIQEQVVLLQIKVKNANLLCHKFWNWVHDSDERFKHPKPKN